MSLFSRLLQAVRSWRPRRPQQKGRRAGVAVERLDHRQLLSVNFTGNVPVDFPATESPGVVVLPDNPSVIHPQIPVPLQNVGVHASGFDLTAMRVSYDSATDTLYLGIEGPPSGNTGQGQVIAGDADDNGNSGTVNPAIPAITDPTNPSLHPYANFQDFLDFEGTEYMGAFLDFTGSGVPQVVAGFSEVSPIGNTPQNPFPNLPPKPYEVAVANPTDLPVFGTQLPQFTGTVFTQNSPTTPNLEFSITHFSQLYQMETGKALTSSSVVYIGGQGGSANDIGISDAFFPSQAVNVGAATQPVSTCPPQSPTIYINPHEHRIIDTLHRDLLRVTILGTSGFNVNDINPATVTLDGVHAIAHVTRKVRRDPFPMATYVFVADQLHLPKGLSNVTLTGTLNNGVTTFSSSTAVLNIPYASQARGPLKTYMGHPAGLYPKLSKIEAKNPGVAINTTTSVALSRSANSAPAGAARLNVSYAPVVQSAAKEAARPVVKVERSQAARTDVISKLPTLLHHSMNDFLNQVRPQSAATRTNARRAG
jgi:hypothetical protein